MQLPLFSIGLSQALFGIVLVLTKRPAKVADQILSALLLAFALMFATNILQVYDVVSPQARIHHLVLSMSYAPLLYLYATYVTTGLPRFRRTDLLHALPPALLIGMHVLPGHRLRDATGILYILLSFAYLFLATRTVLRFKRQRKHQYSYRSRKVSLNWLLAVIFLFLGVYLIILVGSMLLEVRWIRDEFDVVRNGMQLLYVYVISLFGARQIELHPEMSFSTGMEKRESPISRDPVSGKYLNSGLKQDQREAYLSLLIHSMETDRPWQDGELSLAGLSRLTSIPKHHITQVLNENLGKNFYLFVNEYRIAHARTLLLSEEHRNWSILGIARECGFNSKTAFNNFFRKTMNQTPSEYIACGGRTDPSI